MHKITTPVDRLIVAAGIKADNRVDAFKETRILARALERMGLPDLTLGLNAELRACGYDLIREVHSFHLNVFADLKLDDIPSTLERDGRYLREAKPKFLTVKCSAGIASMRALKTILQKTPETEIIGVTVLTSKDEREISHLYGKGIQEAVASYGRDGFVAGIDGFVASAREIGHLRAYVAEGMSMNAVNIRPTWAEVRDDDQNRERSMTPTQAFEAGAHRIIVGRPVNQAIDPERAIMDILEEISKFKFPQ